MCGVLKAGSSKWIPPAYVTSRLQSCGNFQHAVGNYRPKRLIFGAKASQDLFDDMMCKIFGDIPMFLNQRDDILIGGRNIEEQNETLQVVLQRAEDYCVTFNLDKCQFGVEELEFTGTASQKKDLNLR